MDMNGLNIQPNACAPTAVLNGLIYLQNYWVGLGNANPFDITQNAIGNVDTLATDMGTANNNYIVVSNQTTKVVSSVLKNTGPYPANGTVLTTAGGTKYTVLRTAYNVGGTSGPNIQTGLGTYLNAVDTTAPFVSYGQNVDPTAAFLAKVLTDHDAIELGIIWATNNLAGTKLSPSGGGHFVTLQMISMTTATKGSAVLIDPWGASTALGGPGATASKITVQVGVQNGVLAITGKFGDDADTIGNMFGAGGTQMSGLVVLDQIETLPAMALPVAVPEPSTYLAGALLLIPFGISSLRKLRAVMTVG
jgi:hypothetical protein